MADQRREFIAAYTPVAEYKVGTLKRLLNPATLADEDAAYALGTVKSIGAGPAPNMPGYYVFVVTYTDDTEEFFYISPNALVIECGPPEEVADIAVARSPLIIPGKG